jgi:hypothetical protein
MTITSTNTNPYNDSRFARRRSIWKGRHNQLRETVEALSRARGVKVYEYDETMLFEQAWDLYLVAGRLPPKGFGTGKWVVEDPSAKLVNATPSALRSDLRNLWLDFVTVLARRIGFSRSAFDSERDQWNQIKWAGHSLIVFAPGTSSLDLIVSKFGYGESRGDKLKHHFYHWQARSEGIQGAVSIDDYDGAESELLVA